MKILMTNTTHPFFEGENFEVEFFPTIEILEQTNKKEMNKTLLSIHEQDLLIFISRHAVEYGIKEIQRLPIYSSLTYRQEWDLNCAAIGPSTKKALEKFNIKSVICSEVPPYNSETFLELEVLKSVKGKRITLFRGNGGRDLITDTLIERGALVQVCEVYQRMLPSIAQNEMAEKINQWIQFPFDRIVTTSIEGLKNLIILVGKHNFQWLKSSPLLVIGVRMFEYAKSVGFQDIVVAEGADWKSIEATIKRKN